MGFTHKTKYAIINVYNSDIFIFCYVKSAKR